MGLLLALIVGILDHWTGVEIGFSIFYMAPVSLVVWHGSTRAGVGMALLSAAFWLFNDIVGGHLYSHPAIPYWNSIMRFFFFITVVILLDRLKSAKARDRQMATTDMLAGVGNVRFFKLKLEEEKDRALRYNQPLTLCYIDLDNFKQVNDKHGHGAGDRLLFEVATTMRKNLRLSDVVARLGGDEFGILLPQADRPQCEVVVGKMVKELRNAMEQNNWPVTFSVGAITFRKFTETIDEMIRLADAQMYVAKTSGKNRIVYSEFE